MSLDSSDLRYLDSKFESIHEELRRLGNVIEGPTGLSLRVAQHDATLGLHAYRIGSAETSSKQVAAKWGAAFGAIISGVVVGIAQLMGFPKQ